jgi:hydroxyacylglutathione hydrolase
VNGSELRIEPVPAFEDNYVWLLRRDGNPAAAVVDPGDADPVLQRLAEQQLSLGVILITHLHGDHTGGVAELKAAYPDVAVYGPSTGGIAGINRPLAAGDEVTLTELDARFRVIEVPGHTREHIAYYGEGVLFCGDHLFAAGCGRVFTGDFLQMHRSLQRVAELPPETLIYCAHEYTLANIGFARWVEPENQAVLQREEAVGKARRAGVPTVPSTLELELQTNPFLRWDVPEVASAATRYAGHALAGGGEIFAALRRWKDREYD